MSFDELLVKLEINVTLVLERFSGNKMLLERFIKKFPNDKSFHDMEVAFLAQSKAQAEQNAHTLKGITANLGFDKLSKNCASVLEQLRSQNFETAKKEFDILAEEYHRIIMCIEEYGAR